jgi:pimeloyl-ACP methyl ester carboxylesterase
MKLALLFLANAAAYGAAPCMLATNACTEFVTLAGGPARSLIYRTYSLDAVNPAITRALIIVHGTSRDPDNYFRHGLAAEFLANALEDTALIVPRIASADGNCHDKLAENEVAYPCNGDSWRAGGAAPKNKNLTSFDFMDEILRKLALKKAFPNLKTIVIAGHSAGGQFVHRYEMSNTVHESLAVPVTYVVANPSSYAYPDAARPIVTGEKITFGPFRDGRNCTTYNLWPYGFEKRAGGYSAKLTDDQLKKQLISRPVTYMVGEIDVLPLGGFDSSCPAMAQGLTRRARGEAFDKMVNEKLGGHSPLRVIPECGHNARCMFTSEDALPVLFPKEK